MAQGFAGEAAGSAGASALTSGFGAVLSNNISVVSVAVQVVSNALSAEIINRISADNVLSQAVSAVAAGLSNEISIRSAEDAALSARITSVAGAGGQTENFNWKFDTTTAAADPGAGYFRFDNAAPASVTNIYVDDLCDITGLDISTIFGSLSGNFTIYIQQTDDATKFIQFTTTAPWTDNTGWWTIPVTFVQVGSGGLFGNNKKCTWYIINTNAGGGSGVASVTSAEHLSLVNRVSTNSAQMVSADNANSIVAAAALSLAETLSNSLSVEITNRISADNTLSANIASVNSHVDTVSTALSAEIVNRTSADNTLSTTIATKNVIIAVQDDGSAIVSNPSTLNYTGNAVSVLQSAGITKINISVAAGGASVTSAEYTSLVDRVSTLSSQVTSADNANSAAIVSVANLVSALSTIVSNQGSAIAANSADVTSLKDRVSANSALASNIQSAVVANSAQMTSADAVLNSAIGVVSVIAADAISIANIASGTAVNAQSIANVVSAAHASLVTSVAGALSAIAANSAQMTSADNAISNAVSIVSAAQAATSAAVTSVNNRISAISADTTSIHDQVSAILSELISVHNVASNLVSENSRISLNISAISTKVDSVSNAVSIVSVAQATTSADLTSVKSVVAANSADLTSVKNAVSILSQAVSVASVNAATALSVANAVSNAVSVLSVVVSNQGSAIAANSADVTSLKDRVSGISSQTTSIESHVNTVSNAVSVLSTVVIGKNQIITIIDDGTSVISNPTAIEFAGAGVSVSLSGTKAVIIIPGGTGGGSVTSADFTSLRSVVQANSANVTSVTDRVSALSTQVTSALTSLNNIGDVSVPTPADGQVLVFNSAAAQWVASTMPGGAASVTSTEYTSLVDRVSAGLNSVANRITSIHDFDISVLSVAVVSVNNRISNVESALSVETARDIVHSATNQGIADIEKGHLVRVLSATGTGIDVESFDFGATTYADILPLGVAMERISIASSKDVLTRGVMEFTSTEIRLLFSGGGVSAFEFGGSYFTDMTNGPPYWQLGAPTSNIDRSKYIGVALTNRRIYINPTFDTHHWISNTEANVNILNGSVFALNNAVSQLYSVVGINSADVTSLKDRVSANSATLSNALSAIGANSAQMVSADNAISNAVSIVSAAQAATSAAVTSVNNRISGVSADLTSFKASINNFTDVSISSPVSLQALVYVSAAGQWMNRAAGGGGSVTSAEYLSLVDRVSALSGSFGNQLSIISVRIDTLSNNVSAASAAVSVLQSAVNTASNQVSVLQVGVSTASAQLSVIQSALNTVSNQISSLGAFQVRLVSTANPISATALTKISGLSLSMAANAVYQIDGWVLHSLSGTANVYRYGLSTSGTTFRHAAGFWDGMISIGPAFNASTQFYQGRWNQGSFGSVSFSVINGATGVVLGTRLTGLIATSTTGGQIRLQAAVSVATSPITILAGSYIRAYRLQ